MKRSIVFLFTALMLLGSLPAQQNKGMAPSNFEAYNQKRLAEVENQHRLVKTYFSYNAFEEMYLEAEKSAGVAVQDKKAFHDMVYEKYQYEDKSLIIQKINHNELNDINIPAFKKTKIKEYASYYAGAFLQGKTSLLKETAKENANSKADLEKYLSERLGTNVVLSTSCGNVDFDLGSFSGWFGANYVASGAYQCAPLYNGTPGTGTPNPMTSPGFNFTGMNVTGNEHGLCNTGVDPATAALTTVSPFTAGGVSARLGDVTDGCGAAQMSFSFTVSSANINFTYDYAAVLYDGHPPGDSPKIIVGMVDLTTGQPISCASYSVDATQAGLSGSGFVAIGGGLYYKPWSQVFVPLSGYIGKNVQVNLTTTDCNGGAHRGYAYFDFHCLPFFFTMIPGTGCTGNNAQIIAPGGAASYSWTTLGSGAIIGATNTQTITTTTSGDYQVTMTAYGSNCSYTIDTVITIAPTPTPAASFSFVPVCAGVAMPFTDMSVTNGGPPFTSWNWNFGNGGSSTSQNPTNVYTTAGTYTVSFTANNGCPYTYSTTVTVYPNPTVTVTSATVCNGAPPVTLTASGASTYTWNSGGTGASQTVISPSSTTNYTVTGTSSQGCTVTATTTITVNPNPTVTVNNATICDGAGPVNLNAAGASTYTWNTGATGATLSVSPASTTNYTVTGSSPAGCTGIATTSVTVIPNPTVTVVGSQICSGNVAQLNAQGATTYTWTGPGLITNTGQSVTANPTTTSSYTVIGTSATCTATAVGSVTVLPTPSVTVSNQGPFCPGDVVPAASFTPNPNDPNTTYQWANNNPAIGLGSIGSGTTPSFTCAANGTFANIQGVVTVTPTLNGCVGLPDSYTITVKPTPIVHPGPDVEYCPNVSTASITFTCVPGGGSPTFYWTNLNNAIGLASSGSGNLPGFTTVNTGTTVVSASILVHASLNNCPGPDSVLVININPDPKAAFYYSHACIGAQTSLIDESTVGTGTITNWNWDTNNDGLFLDATNPNPSLAFTPAGAHTVGLQVTSNKGCKNQVYEQVYVNYPPTANFAGDNLTGCPVHPVNFTDLSTTVAPANVVSWSWDFGNGQTSVSQQPTTVLYYNSSPLYPISYTVMLTVKTDSGCSASISKNNYITVYPQPIAGFYYEPADADILDPTVHFINTSVGGSGNLPIKYYLGDVFIGYNDPNNWTNLTNPIHKYNDQEPYTYYVTQWVKNIYGCRDSVTHPVVINPAYTFYIPNAFSPNGDGRNEGFKGTGIGIDLTTYNLWIFDRWGNEIFHSVDLEETWDGRVHGVIVQEDVFVWKVRFSDISGAKHEFHGTVSLIK